jgi:hypothetical protein
MATYKYQNYLTLKKHPSFDIVFRPSSPVPCGGIYRCNGCGTEIALEGIGFFPDGRHHTHTPVQGALTWQLVVATEASHPQPYLHGAA